MISHLVLQEKLGKYGMMNLKDLKQIACAQSNGTFYDELNSLKDDIEFFRAYLRRNKKSNFAFDVRVSQQSSRKAFDDIWKTYNYDIEYIENVYVVFIVLKYIITNMTENKTIFTDEEIYEFDLYMKLNYGLDIIKYVEEFIGCGSEIRSVIDRINNIVQNHPQVDNK